MITLLNEEHDQILTILHTGRGSLRTLKSDYVIYGQPLIVAETSRAQ